MHALLPGFPSQEALRDRETLARALAGFVHGCSIWHSAEHHAYAEIPLHHAPHRLRVAPPTGNDTPTAIDERLSRVDLFRQEMARQMFYEVHTIRRLTDVHYGFREPELQAAAQAFQADLRRCDRAQPDRFIPLDQIACSIQF